MHRPVTVFVQKAIYSITGNIHMHVKGKQILLYKEKENILLEEASETEVVSAVEGALDGIGALHFLH